MFQKKKRYPWGTRKQRMSSDKKARIVAATAAGVIAAALAAAFGVKERDPR